MGREWRISAIVSMVFGRFDLFDGELCGFNLVGLSKRHPSRGNVFKIFPNFLVHLLNFVDFSASSVWLSDISGALT